MSGDRGNGAPKARTPLGVRLDRLVMHWASAELFGARIPARPAQGKQLSARGARPSREMESGSGGRGGDETFAHCSDIQILRPGEGRRPPRNDRRNAQDARRSKRPQRTSSTRRAGRATSSFNGLRHNVKVTGTLRQGAARCRISNGASRPLAATCPCRPTCYAAAALYLARRMHASTSS